MSKRSQKSGGTLSRTSKCPKSLKSSRISIAKSSHSRLRRDLPNMGGQNTIEQLRTPADVLLLIAGDKLKKHQTKRAASRNEFLHPMTLAYLNSLVEESTDKEKKQPPALVLKAT